MVASVLVGLHVSHEDGAGTGALPVQSVSLRALGVSSVQSVSLCVLCVFVVISVSRSAPAADPERLDVLDGEIEEAELLVGAEKLGEVDRGEGFAQAAGVGRGE